VSCENNLKCSGLIFISCRFRNLFFLILLCFVTKASSVFLNCGYHIDPNFNPIHEANSIACEASKLKVINPNEKVTQALNNYAAGNDQVRTLYIYKQTMNFIPSGIEKVFPNLRGFLFTENDVVRVFQSDFKPFPELRGLWLRGNKRLDVLERDLFKFNKKLYYLNLWNNNFKFIDANILDGFSSLSVIDLNANPCIKMASFNEETSRYKKALTRKCQNAKILAMQTEFKKVNHIKDA